jgi:hypothetical protein
MELARLELMPEPVVVTRMEEPEEPEVFLMESSMKKHFPL